MKIAIVTGASSGMGREFVRQMHRYIQPDMICLMRLSIKKCGQILII